MKSKDYAHEKRMKVIAELVKHWKHHRKLCDECQKFDDEGSSPPCKEGLLIFRQITEEVPRLELALRSYMENMHDTVKRIMDANGWTEAAVKEMRRKKLQ